MENLLPVELAQALQQSFELPLGVKVDQKLLNLPIFEEFVPEHNFLEFLVFVFVLEAVDEYPFVVEAMFEYFAVGVKAVADVGEGGFPDDLGVLGLGLELEAGL